MPSSSRTAAESPNAMFVQSWQEKYMHSLLPFDHAYIIKHDLERILGCQIPLSMLTDSEQIFDVSHELPTPQRRD